MCTQLYWNVQFTTPYYDARIVYDVQCTTYTVRRTMYVQLKWEVNTTRYKVYSVYCIDYATWRTHYIQCTEYIIHYTDYTIHCTDYTIHCKLVLNCVHSVYRTTPYNVYGVHYTVYTIHCTMYIVHCHSRQRQSPITNTITSISCPIQFKPSLQCIVYYVQCIVYYVQCTVYCVQGIYL